MNDASVGFQCPDCVRRGARETRSGRTTYGGLRTDNPALTSIALIVVNVAVWLLILATGRDHSAWISRLALMPVGKCSPADRPWLQYVGIDSAAACPPGGAPGTWIQGVADGAWWQLLSSTFTHVEILHIGFNMLALYFLGPQLEAALGRARFLTLYLGSGLTASAVVYWLADPGSLTLGASGSIFGLLAGLLVVAHKVGADLSQLLIWIGLNVVITFTASGISWQGHLGGFVGGLVIAAIIVYAPRQRRSTWQLLGMGLVLAAVAAAIAARTAVLL